MIRPHGHDGKILVTVHCEIEEGQTKRGNIQLNFEPMTIDRAIGLLSPFSFEVQEEADDAP